MKEQTNATVYLSGNPDKELEKVTAWRNSATVVWLHVPYFVSTLTFKVGNAEATKYVASLTAAYHPSRGLWRVYIPAARLSFAGRTYYKVVTTDDTGARNVGGEGVLNIKAGKIDDADDNAARSAVVYYSGTDKWYGVTITEDDSGAPVFKVDEDNPYDADAYTARESQAYAYNNSTGLYHAVTATADDSGKIVLACDEEGVEGGEDTFAYSSETGFWYRLEATEDDSGSIAIQTGETI